MKILIIEDEKDLANSAAEYLTGQNYKCELAYNYDEALDKLELYQYDCAVVDIMLPDGNGLELIKYLKERHSDSGIIIVSAKNALDDRIKGLNLGADDYLTKPFHLAELNARIDSIIRRRKFKGNEEVVFDELKIIPHSRLVFVNDITLDLTKKEYDLLLFFLSNKNKVLTREAIAENLLGDQADMMDSFDFIYSHVKNLRKKILNAKGKDRIKTIYSIGYKFKMK
ncbi:MAG TPA: response regulator transcription factor [Ignavibacteria bacterium]|nr:response regulator transcription factor [Ignavibacteria bacterium]